MVLTIFFFLFVIYSIGDPDNQVLSIVIKLIIDRLMLTRRSLCKSDDGVITNASSLTSLTWSSPRSSFDGPKLVKLKESIKRKDSSDSKQK